MEQGYHEHMFIADLDDVEEAGGICGILPLHTIITCANSKTCGVGVGILGCTLISLLLQGSLHYLLLVSIFCLPFTMSA